MDDKSVDQPNGTTQDEDDLPMPRAYVEQST